VPLVLRVCDHVYVLNFGRLLAEGEPSVIQTHPEVVAAYLGGEAPEALAATQETAEDAALDESTHDAMEHPREAKPVEVKAPRKRAPAKKATPRKHASPKRKKAASNDEEAS
jgi:ABC-type multidrug transport system ATPase subunit